MANPSSFHSMNLAMKRKLWTMSQQDLDDERTAQKKWFIFIDTDTFIEWGNLLELLQHLDPAEKTYLGSPVWLPGLEFAHGGSAYVLSYGALEALNRPNPHNDPKGPFYSQYGLNVTALCCGDEALARVLKSKGVSLKGYWPMFNGEIPATVPFGKDQWCEPVISLHHIGGKDMEHLWKWVEEWKVRTMNMVLISTSIKLSFCLWRRDFEANNLTKCSIPSYSKTCSTTSLLNSLAFSKTGTISTKA